MAKLTDTIILGDLTVTGTTRFKNDVTMETEINSNFIPDVDGSYSLGTAVLRFSTLYAQGIDVEGQIISIDTDTNNILTLGNSTNASAVQISASGNDYSLTVNGSLEYSITAGTHYLEDGPFYIRKTGFDTMGLTVFDDGANGTFIMTRDSASWNESVRITETHTQLYSQNKLASWDGNNFQINGTVPAFVLHEDDAADGTDYFRIIKSGGNTYLQEEGGNIRFTGYNAVDIPGSFQVRTGGSYHDIWHEGNDGAGSGLDADTLDGVQGANYLRSDTSDTLAGVLTVGNNINGNHIILDGDGYFGYIGADTARTFFYNNSGSRALGLGVDNNINFEINTGGEYFSFYDPTSTLRARIDTSLNTDTQTRISAFGSAYADLYMYTTTTNSWTDILLTDNTGSPYVHWQTGSAVDTFYADFNNFYLRDNAGGLSLTINSSGDTDVYGTLDVRGSQIRMNQHAAAQLLIQPTTTNGATHIEVQDPDNDEARYIMKLWGDYDTLQHKTLFASSTGRVGIGDDVDISYVLNVGGATHVGGDFYMTGGGAQLSQVLTANAGNSSATQYLESGGGGGIVGYDGSNNYLRINGATASFTSTNHFVMNSTGEVGIGAAPDTGWPLVVDRNTGTHTLIQLIRGSASGAYTTYARAAVYAWDVGIRGDSDFVIRNNSDFENLYIHTDSAQLELDATEMVWGQRIDNKRNAADGTAVEHFVGGYSDNDRAFRILSETQSGARYNILTNNLAYDGTNYTQGNWSGSDMIRLQGGSVQFYSDDQVTGGSTDIITPTLIGEFHYNGFKLQNAVYVTNIYDNDSLSENSATALATQQSIKAYADNNFLQLSGGTMTGAITNNAAMYWDNAGTGNLHAILSYNDASTGLMVITPDNANWDTSYRATTASLQMYANGNNLNWNGSTLILPGTLDLNATTSVVATLENTAGATIVESRGGNGYGSFYSIGSGTNHSYMFFGNVTSGERGRVFANNDGDMHVNAITDVHLQSNYVTKLSYESGTNRWDFKDVDIYDGGDSHWGLGSTPHVDRKMYILDTVSSDDDVDKYALYVYQQTNSGSGGMTADQDRTAIYARSQLNDASTSADATVAVVTALHGYAQNAGGHSDNMYAVYGLATTTASDAFTQNTYGGRFEARLDNAGAEATTLYGVLGAVRLTADADDTGVDTYGVRSYLDQDSATATISTHTMFYGISDIEAATGTITTMYGLHVNMRDNIDGTVTNRRGIWIEGPDDDSIVHNHINGKTIIGNGSSSFDTSSYVLKVDDNATSGNGLHVTGGGSGGVLARFERNVGSTGTIDIHASNGDPTIAWDVGSTGTRDWSIGAGDTTNLYFSEDSTPYTDPLLTLISGSGMSLRNNNWLYFKDSGDSNSMNIGSSGNSMYLQNYYAGGSMAFQMAGSNTTGDFIFYDHAGTAIVQIDTEHGRVYNYTSGDSATMYHYWYNNHQAPNASTTHAFYYGSRSSDNNYEWIGSQQYVISDNTAGDEHSYWRQYISSNGSLLETIRSQWDRTYIFTEHGNVQIGPQNATYCHFTTDRAHFYFNKNIYVDGVAYLYDDTSNYMSVGTWRINSESARARMWIHGEGTGYTAADLLLEDDSGQTSRGMGMYMYNRASGAEWYVGQPYNSDEQDFVICYAVQSNGNEGAATATQSNALLRLDQSVKYLYLDQKDAIRFGDNWLRLNNSQSFTSGIYCGGGVFRTDGQLQVGAAGATFLVNGATITHQSNTVWTAGNDGSGSGLDADLLDGVHGSSFIRSDAADAKTSGTLTFNDSVICSFGTGNDFEVFHNGTHAYMDMNLGNLYVRDSTTTRFTFDDNGDFTATGDVTAYSDARLKNIKKITDRPDLFENLVAYDFDWKDGRGSSIGPIAQDVQRDAPELVKEDEEGNLSLDYGKYAVAALHESKKRVKHLEEKLEKLEALINKMIEEK